MILDHSTGTLTCDGCAVMGVVNRTPDSFYDAGRMELGDSVAHALSLAEEGAVILDLGAVKAGPGESVSESEELDRLLPLVEAAALATQSLISIETHRPGIVRAGVAAGASMVNDVSGMADPELAEACADTGAALILMHNGGQIRGRPRHPRYEDIVSEVLAFWDERAALARSLGVAASRLVVDPGLDFGKTTFHSLELIRELDRLVAFGLPVLVAPSRKDVVGETLDEAPSERLEGTLALVALAVEKGAAIVRVHDVWPAIKTVAMVEAVMGGRRPVAPIRGLWD